MPREAKVTVVLDPEDDQRHLQFVRDLHDLAAGRAVIEARPVKHPYEFAKVAFASMGKERGPSFEGWPEGLAGLLADWLAAEPVRDLYVLRAHTDVFNIAETLRLADALKLSAWLVLAADRVRSRFQHVLAGRAVEQITFEEFQARHLDVRSSSPAVLKRATFPAVPDDEVWTFLDACDAFIARARDRDRVWRAFTAATQRTLDWLPQHPQPTAYDIGVMLRGLVDGAATADEAVTHLRGAQAAFFRARWLLTFAPAAVRATHRARPRTLDRALLDALRGYWDTEPAAAGLLATLAPVTGTDLAGLTVDDVRSDGRKVQLLTHAIDVPASAASILRARVRTARREVPDDSSPQLLGRDGVDLARTLDVVLDTVANECGVVLSPHWTAADADAGHRAWLSRHAVGLAPL
jgi:hypothetical protein